MPLLLLLLPYVPEVLGSIAAGVTITNYLGGGSSSSGGSTDGQLAPSGGDTSASLLPWLAIGALSFLAMRK